MTTETIPKVDAIRVGEFLIVEETGEILEGPIDRLELLQAQHLLAREQEKSWESVKQTCSRALGRMLAELGAKSTSTDQGRSTAVAPGTRKKAPAKNVRAAVLLELLTDEQATDLIITAAKDLDVDEVELAIEGLSDGDELLSSKLYAVLIDESERAGYVLTRPPQLPAPRKQEVSA